MVWTNVEGEIQRPENGLLLSVDKKLSITGVNPELCKLLGICEENLFGRSLVEVFDFEPSPWMDRLLAGERPSEQAPELSAKLVSAKLDLTLRLEGIGTPVRGYVFKVLRHQPSRTFYQQDCDYEIELTGGTIGKLVRVAFLGGSACEQDLEGRMCFDVVCGRPTTCERCPALLAIRKPIGGEHALVRQQGPLFELSTAKRVGFSRVLVRSRHISAAHLRVVREARISQLAQDAALSEREREVLEHILLGAPLEEIAQKLDISSRTVKFHQANLLAKLGADSRVDLLRVLA